MTEDFFFQCPYCWENVSMIIDKSVHNDSYIEDCEVCCNPIEVEYQSNGDEIINFSAISIEQ
jgi:transcription elongation factor Elf1